MGVTGGSDVIAQNGWISVVEGCLRELRNTRIRCKEESQRADVCWWKWQACEVVVCTGGLKDSGEAALLVGVVLVRLGLCADLIDHVL